MSKKRQQQRSQQKGTTSTPINEMDATLSHSTTGPALELGTNEEEEQQPESTTQREDESAPAVKVGGAEEQQDSTGSFTPDDEEWQTEGQPPTSTPPPVSPPAETPSPREDKGAQIAAAFSESSKGQKNLKIHELRIKVAPSETNSRILEVAEHAVANSSAFEGRLIHREATRTILEVESCPVTIDITLSQDLDRIVLVKAFEPVPEHLFSVLRDAFANQVQLSTRVPDNLAGLETEHDEPIDGPAVKAMLDPDYVALLKKEMQQRSERDLTAFATPLERRAKDDEKRVAKLQKLLAPKYEACHMPLPAIEKPPPLSSFPLIRSDSPATLTLRKNPTPREVDAQLKMAIRRDLHGDSLARQERKKKEVQARAEACERNRLQLVSILAGSRAALELDLAIMARLGVHPPQVALCRVPCIYGRKPGHLIACQQLIIFEPVGFLGWRLSGTLKIAAQQCRSVMKGRPTLGIVDSLCLRMDDQQEHVFYMATMDDTNEVLDQVFELIWQILRMNRWDDNNSNMAAGSEVQTVTV